MPSFKIILPMEEGQKLEKLGKKKKKRSRSEQVTLPPLTPPSGAGTHHGNQKEEKPRMKKHLRNHTL